MNRVAILAASGLIAGAAFTMGGAFAANPVTSFTAGSSNTVQCPTALSNGKKSADSEVIKCAKGSGPTTTTTVPVTTTTVPSTTTTAPGDPGTGMSAYWQQFSNGPDPSGNPNYIPIGVWEQAGTRTESVNGGPSQDNALNYESIGINFDANGYSLNPADGWQQWGGIAGTGSDGLAAPYTVASPDNTGNFLDDEADMNQINEPANNQRTSIKYAAEGSAVAAADPTRPVYSNFGKCVSLLVSEDGWAGCHLDNESPQAKSDLALDQQYCSGQDVASSDYYGYTDPYEPASIHGAWAYGAQVDGTRLACGPDKPVLGFVETGHPFNVANNAAGSTITPSELQAALNVELVHGANGFLYFVHDFNNNGIVAEDGLFAPGQQEAALPVVKAFNAEVDALAPWINAPSSSAASVVTTGNVPVTTMLKTYNGHTYLFAATDGNSTMTASGSTTATFTVPVGSATSAVYGESRTVDASSGTFSDSFSPYQLHVYQLS